MMELALSPLPLYHGRYARSICGERVDFFAVEEKRGQKENAEKVEYVLYAS